MTSTLMTHTCADRDRALAEGCTTPRAGRHGAATGLIAGIVAVWTAPVTRESNNVDPDTGTEAERGLAPALCGRT